jgi:hypothetical protein
MEISSYGNPVLYEKQMFRILETRDYSTHHLGPKVDFIIERAPIWILEDCNHMNVF